MIEGVGADAVMLFGGLVVLMVVFIQKLRASSLSLQDEVEHTPVATQNQQDETPTSSPPSALRLRREISGECSICLDSVRLPCLTNCGHYFCTGCFTEYWQRVSRPRTIACPNCRSQVNMLHSYISLENAENAEDAAQMRTAIAEFNQRVSTANRSVAQAFRDSPLLFQRLREDLASGDHQTQDLLYQALIKFHNILFFIIVVFYILSPLDLFPEAAFGVVGILDDILVVATLVVYISSIYRSVLLHRSRQISNNG
mmetsp:Transcript_10691/g.13873  ORF Transcript_10691/g.13873 Transcript_10691/m.13873 type:complete len:256 (+) Transcript_10691:276-1043(+)